MTPLVGSGDAALVLRLDPALDGEVQDAVRRLEEAFARVHGDADFEVVLETRPMDRAAWEALGRAVQAQVLLPSTAAGARREMARACGVHPLVDAEAVARWLADVRAGGDCTVLPPRAA